MIVTQTPFRICLGGGGTDLPAYYIKHGGFIFATGITKYMYIAVSEPFDDLIRLKYSKYETVDDIEKIEHTIAREALRLLNIKGGIDVVSLADLPAGIGLGSSSCYAVGLLGALHSFKWERRTQKELAEEACKLEIDILKEPVGKQDQYMAAFGGLTVLIIDKDGCVSITNARINSDTSRDLNRNMLLFYTGTTRDAKEVLSDQRQNIINKKALDDMHFIKDIGFKVLEAAESGNITDIGLLFDEHWRHKKKTSSKMTNKHFDEIYEIAKEEGALGGKIPGAGGSGCCLFYVESHHKKFIEKMEKLGLRQIRYKFDLNGTRIIADE